MGMNHYIIPILSR